MDGRSRQNPAYRPATGEPRASGALPFFLTLKSKVRLLAKSGSCAGILSLALAALVPAVPSRADPGAGDALLRRHAPILRYDSRERLRATAVEALTARRLTARGAEATLSSCISRLARRTWST